MNLRDLFQIVYEYPFISFFFSIFVVTCLGILTNIRLVSINIGNKEINEIKEVKKENNEIT